MILTFLLVSCHANALTLDGVLDFNMNFVREKRTEVDGLDKANKEDFVVNKLENDNNQTLTFGKDSDKCTLVRANMSLSKILKSPSQ